ncbi:MAG: Gfo/Idh/MocA family protein [Spirochaetia bacterium]
MKLRSGIIGCGNISKFHFDALNKLGQDITWVCDIDEAAGRKRAAEYNASFSRDYRALLKSDEVDVVHVTLISKLHKEICLAALDQGKHVICEKTLSENAADSMEIVRKAENKGAHLYTAYMKRYLPGVVKSAELLGSLGNVLSARFFTYQNWGNLLEPVPEGSFFYTPENGQSAVKQNYGGGILYCGGSHILDLIGRHFGRPRAVSGFIRKPPHLDYEIFAGAMLNYSDFPVMFEAAAHPLAEIGFLKDGWMEGFSITGTNGRIEFHSSKWDEVEIKAPKLIYYDNNTGREEVFDFEPVSPFYLAIKSFYEDIGRDRQTVQSRSTGYEVDMLIEEIMLSARKGEAREIAWG